MNSATSVAPVAIDLGWRLIEGFAVQPPANALMRDLARIPVPLNVARNGACYQDPALLRGRNHVVAAARRATRMIEAALAAA